MEWGKAFSAKEIDALLVECSSLGYTQHPSALDGFGRRNTSNLVRAGRQQP